MNNLIDNALQYSIVLRLHPSFFGCIMYLKGGGRGWEHCNWTKYSVYKTCFHLLFGLCLSIYECNLVSFAGLRPSFDYFTVQTIFHLHMGRTLQIISVHHTRYTVECGHYVAYQFWVCFKTNTLHSSLLFIPLWIHWCKQNALEHFIGTTQLKGDNTCCGVTIYQILFTLEHTLMLNLYSFS